VRVPPTAESTVVAYETCPFDCPDHVIFHSDRTGDWELFRLTTGDPNGGVKLTYGEGSRIDDVAPNLSPDGEWIAFTSNRDGNWEIYIAPTEGGIPDAVRRITYNNHAVDADPVWSVNNQLVFETTINGTFDLYLLNMTTGEGRLLTEHSANDINPAWSPDGEHVLFTSDRDGLWQTYELAVSTGQLRRLSNGRGDDLDPAYSLDGTRILFRSYQDNQHSTIYVMNRDGSGATAISASDTEAVNAVWSPNSELIAYQAGAAAGAAAGSEIYVYDDVSGTTRQLTDNDIPDYAPTWRCDPTQLVWTSEIDGDPNLYQVDVLPLDAPPIEIIVDAEQLTTHPANDIYPLSPPSEEDASRELQLPGAAIGEVVQRPPYTRFLPPRAYTTLPDELINKVPPWQPVMLTCPRVG